MAGRRIAAVALALAALFAPALTTEAEPPTGMIEVEVVYKDTGEPVEPHFSVEVLAGERPVEVLIPVRSGIAKVEVPCGEYTVRVGTIGPGPWLRRLNQASPFITYGQDSCAMVTVTEDKPVARVRFETERGWQFSGAVRRHDGSPVPNALVMVEQGASRDEWAYSFTEPDGTFSMLGVVPAVRARVQIESVVETPGFRPAGTALLYTGETDLTGEKTEADFSVEVAAISLTIDVAVPLWPFGEVDNRWAPVVGIWIEHDPGASDPSAEPDLVLDFPLSLSWVPKRGIGVAPYVRYSQLVRDLPEGEEVTVGIGFKDRMLEEPYNPSAGCTFYGYQRVTVTAPTRSVRLGIGAPGARASRVFWASLVALVVLLICVPVLARRTRGSRRAVRQGG